jgi:hypothetical protein
VEHLADIVGTFALMGIALSRNVDEWIEFARVGPSAPLIEEVRFATDSAVEERGFEPLVPLTDESPFQILFCRPELHRLKADPARGQRPTGPNSTFLHRGSVANPVGNPASYPKFCG